MLMVNDQTLREMGAILDKSLTGIDAGGMSMSSDRCAMGRVGTAAVQVGLPRQPIMAPAPGAQQEVLRLLDGIAVGHHAKAHGEHLGAFIEGYGFYNGGGWNASSWNTPLVRAAFEEALAIVSAEIALREASDEAREPERELVTA